jgi:predicted acyltransferase
MTRNPSKHARLQALDLVRGFTVWLMIFVDDVRMSCGVGGALRAARRRHDLLRDARCPLREELDESALG